MCGRRERETQILEVGGKRFEITGTPCEHLPGGEVTGFIVSAPSFGTTDGKPNAIYFSGDTIYLPGLAKMKERFRTPVTPFPQPPQASRTNSVPNKKDISAALLNIGKATVHLPTGPLHITLDGADAARLFREIGADVLVPMHFESWNHFAEKRAALAEAFEKAGVKEKVLWLEPGVRTGLV